jgi:hypothetical protein
VGVPDAKRIVGTMRVETAEVQQTQNHVIFLENFFDAAKCRVASSISISVRNLENRLTGDWFSGWEMDGRPSGERRDTGTTRSMIG